MREPSIAVWLLQLFCRDEALVGDILEEYDARGSRAWLWRQVGMAVVFALPYGMVRRERRTAKMQMPIGGLGFVAIVGIITIVAPGAWWFVAFGALGGVLLAVTLVAARERRVLRQPPAPRNVILR
jgi:hypothetical protein